MMAREGKYSQITLATDEDLERDFPDWFAFGFPVRPPPEIAVTPKQPLSRSDED